MSAQTIILALIGLGLMIVVHEAGHFIVARLCGMRVERFSVGFGPTILSWKRGDTTYQIAPILLGGYVQIVGLNPYEDYDKDDPRAYPNRPRWMQLATLVAGPAANYLSAVAIVLIMFLAFGAPNGQQKVDEPLPGKPAAAAGIQAGDVLVEANGQAISLDHPITEVIGASGGAPVTIKVLRDGKPMTFAVTPYADGKKLMVGMALGYVLAPTTVGVSVRAALAYPVETSELILSTLGRMITGRQKADLHGPVAIVKQMADAARRGLRDFLGIVAAISVYLGLFNLLPIPALDGGRAVFVTLGALLRRRINPFLEAKIHSVGFVLLFGLMLVVTAKDVFIKS